jgi:hypothetical protein
MKTNIGWLFLGQKAKRGGRGGKYGDSGAYADSIGLQAGSVSATGRGKVVKARWISVCTELPRICHRANAVQARRGSVCPIYAAALWEQCRELPSWRSKWLLSAK